VTRARGPLRRLQRRWKDGWIARHDAPDATRAKAIDMLLFDHGLLRKVWRNEYEIDAGVWRSSQPDPAAIRRLAARGIRAIVNLRGATEWGSYFIEREACRSAGIDLIDFKLSSRALPTRAQILELDALFEGLPRPFLMHCKSGADRAGFAAALYLLLHCDLPVEKAGRQLSWRYLHLRGGASGVLHRLLERYAADTADRHMCFRDWVEKRYDRESIAAEFMGAAPIAGFGIERLLARE